MSLPYGHIPWVLFSWSCFRPGRLHMGQYLAWHPRQRGLPLLPCDKTAKLIYKCTTFLQVQKLKIVVHIVDSNPTWFIIWPIHLVDNANWTAWSVIWSEILHVISKSNERAALVQFEINRSMISDQSCMTWSLTITSLHSFCTSDWLKTSAFFL